MNHQHLYLTGYRGCGKSTVRKLLAQQLDLRSCDLDDLIEADAGITIKEIFSNESEIGFRDREQACLDRVSKQPPQVIALGGGAILRPENQETIRQTGWCVWLDATPEIVAQRLAEDETTRDRRPALTDLPMLEEIREVMTSRQPIYHQVADFRVDTTDKTIDQIVGEITQARRARV